MDYFAGLDISMDEEALGEAFVDAGACPTSMR